MSSTLGYEIEKARIRVRMKRRIRAAGLDVPARELKPREWAMLLRAARLLEAFDRRARP